MRTETNRKGLLWNIGVRRIWAFFVVLVVALICSAVAGTQSVRASADCTTTQCDDASGYAYITCFNRGGVTSFRCPVPGETDDFDFQCFTPYYEIDDCSIFGG